MYAMITLSSPFQTACFFQFPGIRKDITLPLLYTSSTWFLGLFTFGIQFSLGLLILLNQWHNPKHKSDWDIPVRTDLVVIIGQFMSVIVALMTQIDILTTVRDVILLWYGKGEEAYWNKLIGEENNQSLQLWLYRILFPNVLKMLQGLMILITNFFIIIQSKDIVDLLKGFTALFVTSSEDNLIFMVSDYGYLGIKGGE